MSSPSTPHLEDGVGLGTAFKALNHPVRRRILVALQEQNHCEVATFTSRRDGADSVELQLQHTHLPRLTDYGFIDWDRTDETVSRGPMYDAIEPLLQVLDDHQDELPGFWP